MPDKNIQIKTLIKIQQLCLSLPDMDWPPQDTFDISDELMMTAGMMISHAGAMLALFPEEQIQEVALEMGIPMHKLKP